jgi:hypothetical protein
MVGESMEGVRGNGQPIEPERQAAVQEKAQGEGAARRRTAVP